MIELYFAIKTTISEIIWPDWWNRKYIEIA